MESTEITQKTELNEFQVVALQQAQKDYENLQKELSSKKYLVDLKKDDIDMLLNFIEKDAIWKFTECLGIKEVAKELFKASKSGKLFTTSLAIEAIYYYLSKVEGKGIGTNASSFTDIEDYLRVLKSITNGIEKIKADTEKLKQAEFTLAARAEGIEPETTI